MGEVYRSISETTLQHEALRERTLTHQRAVAIRALEAVAAELRKGRGGRATLVSLVQHALAEAQLTPWGKPEAPAIPSGLHEAAFILSQIDMRGLSATQRGSLTEALAVLRATAARASGDGR